MSEMSQERGMIECPACQTRFALLMSVLKTQENPRFECSNCDNRFTVSSFQIQPMAPAHPPKPVGPKSMEDAEAAASLERTFNRPEPATASQTVGGLAGNVALKDPQPATSQIDPGNYVIPKPTPDTSFQPVPPPYGEPSQAPVAQHSHAQAAHPQTENAAAALGDANLHLPNHQTPSRDEGAWTLGATGGANNALNSRGDMPAASFDTSTKNTYRTPASAPKQGVGELPPKVTSKGKTPQSLSTPTNSIKPKKPTSPWMVLALLCIPLLVATGILWYAGNYLVKNPEKASEFSQSLGLSDGSQVAPPELYLEDTSMTPITLEDGSRVFYITARLKNRTTETYSAVKIEGRLFSSSGDTLETITVEASNPFKDTHLRSLTPSLIGELQQRTTRRSRNFEPGNEREISVVLLDSADKPAESYAVRVHSVKTAG